MNTQASIEIFVIAEAVEQEQISNGLRATCPNAIVHAEENIAEVSSYLQSHHPDLIFLDWNHAGVNIEDLCKRFLKNSIHESALIVAIIHDAQQYSRALRVAPDHIIDLSYDHLANSILESNLRLLKELEEARSAMRILQSRIRSKEAGEQQLISAMEKMVQVRFPETVDSVPFILHSVEWIAEQFRNEEESDVEKAQMLYAARLVSIGKLHLPDSERHTRITLDGVASNTYTAFTPLQADAILSGVDVLEGARVILKNLYENYDGTGFPDRKQHWQIPLGSRILRAVSDLDEIARLKKISITDALEHLKRFNRHVYDHRIVALLEEYILNVSKRSNDRTETRAVQLFDLSEGMQLASDIVTNSGLKLMNAGTVLRDQLIRRIQSHNAMDPILGHIYIREH